MESEQLSWFAGFILQYSFIDPPLTTWLTARSRPVRWSDTLDRNIQVVHVRGKKGLASCNHQVVTIRCGFTRSALGNQCIASLSTHRWTSNWSVPRHCSRGSSPQPLHGSADVITTQVRLGLCKCRPHRTHLLEVFLTRLLTKSTGVMHVLCQCVRWTLLASFWLARISMQAMSCMYLPH